MEFLRSAPIHPRAIALLGLSLALTFLLPSCYQVLAQATPVQPTARAARVGNLELELRRLHQGSRVPALAAAIIADGQITGVGAVGLRKNRDPTLVRSTDKFHIGSCAKSMTATLAAVLVQEGRIQWSTTLSDVFTDYEIHPEYRSATLLHLLSHGAGFPATNFATPLWREIWASKENGRAQRAKLARARLREKPGFKPGTGFAYSNAGYAIAGAMLEKATGRTWESLIRSKIFQPLGMSSAGFRAPASKDTVDQPWGHKTNSTPARPVPYGDSPDALGPAGTIHCSMQDWAKYVLFHIQGNPRVLANNQSLAFLHQIHNPKGNYALGWRVRNDAQRGRILTHGGTNKMWYAQVWVAPERGNAVVIACNAGTAEGNTLCQKTLAALTRGL